MIGLQVDASELSKVVTLAEGVKPKKRDLRLLVLRCAILATGDIRLTVKEKIEHQSRGKLARSFRETFLGHKGEVTSAASHSKLIYAGIQNEGGVIRAKGKKLAVPIRAAKIPAGKSPKHWPEGALHFIPRPGKPPLLVTFKTKGPGYTKDKETGKRIRKEGPSQLVAMEPKYVLVSKVTLKPKQYIEEAAKKTEPKIETAAVRFTRKLAIDATVAAAKKSIKKTLRRLF